MDYRKCASEILNGIGGKENLVSAAHCATRLRLVIADNSKAPKDVLEDIDGVKGVFEASGQLQIILGTGTVNKVYDEFIALSGAEAASKDDVKQAAAAKAPWYKQAIKTLGDIFVPIIPAIVASGFLMGIMEALNFMVNNGYLNIDTSGSIYVFSTLFSNAAYTFLQILIAFSAAKVFGGNPYLGAVIGMIMIHPNLQNAYTVATQGVLETQSVWFGLYDIDMIGYQGHVIPVIIAVFVMSWIEKRLHKIVPATFDLFVTPLVSVFVTGYLTLSIIGPVFVFIENALLNGVQALITLPFGIGSFIMGGFYSATVVAGIHHMYTVIDVGQLALYGMTYWLPLASAANIAQGGATLAVALKSKDPKVKAMALPSSMSCFMGITEPAIFGVNLRYFKPFICGAIGGACGALYASLVHLGATGTGVTGIFGLLLCLNNPINYIIMFLIAGGVAFALTWMFGYKDAEKKAVQAEFSGEAPGTSAAPAVEVSAQATDPNVVNAPLTGTVVPLEQVPDATFAEGILGQGAAITPTEGKVVAPADGEVSTLFDTHHAIGLTLDSGVELLIHIGINTVELNGEGYTAHVQEGDRVKQGQTLITFDKDFITQKGYQVITPVIVTNSDDYAQVTLTASGEIAPQAPLLHIEKEG